MWAFLLRFQLGSSSNNNQFTPIHHAISGNPNLLEAVENLLTKSSCDSNLTVYEIVPILSCCYKRPNQTKYYFNKRRENIDFFQVHVVDL